MSVYDHKTIEEKWSKQWYKDNLYKAVDFSEKPKKYILAEFPYPSGKALHAGHMMRYTVPDVYSRYLRMNGYNVLFPMGWDAFGLPAENYAVKTGIHPEITVKKAIKNYKNSMKKMGYGFDWEREINTTDPNYYKWTQWLFLKFWEKGLAEYKEMPIWWCENLKTVLSDEEILTDKDGNKISERGEHPVEKKMLKQWILKIPEYAEKLIAGLDSIDFPNAIKQAQLNWIGKSEGAYIKFEVFNTFIETFTTRPDTIFGTTFLAIAPEHPILNKLLSKTKNKSKIKKYVEKTASKSDLERQTDKEKSGVKLEGVLAKHPLTKTPLPIFVADYVLMDYGTGIVMGVPAHDERDFEFAKTHELEIINVVKGPNNEPLPYTGEGTMINSDKYNGLGSQKFWEKIVADLEKKNKGVKAVTYKIRDWIFSRQRYWGEPIPLIHKKNGEIKALCDTKNAKEVEENLPLELPKVPDYNPTADGTSPLAKNKEWVETKAKDGTLAKRETNTMPNWAGSCWYYMRFIDPQNDKAFADYKKLKYWLPVDKYFGGAEHTTMHLLYSRFWHRFFYDLKIVPTKEPYAWRMNGGLLLGPDGKKMSKSKGNVIEPMDIVENYGADALRMYICFLGPYTDTYPWNDTGIKSTWRLLKNVWEVRKKVVKTPTTSLVKPYHKMLKNVTGMIKNLKMNTAISQLMIFINQAKKEKEIDAEIWKGFIKVLAPFAPFIAEELWQEINKDKTWKKENSIHVQPWPNYNEELAKDKILLIPVQVNGKVRGEIEVEEDESEGSVKEKTEPFAKGKKIKKVIYVPGKIVNLVV